ncbi:hypothetical protein RB195_015554 [Necator americanus]|uniref:Uncharacterized protein n=1 Tax=Necator americanus TaxID=51031 RepID=A0ABR1E6B6_NECAM
MTICHNNARTFASDVAIEDLMMQASKFKNAVIRLTETRQCHPHNLVYETAEGQFLETSNSCGVGGVSVFVNTNMTMNIDSFEQITTRIGRLVVDGKMWSNPSFGHLRLLRSNIKLQKKKTTKLLMWTWRSSIKKTISSTRSLLLSSTPKLAREEHFSNFIRDP